MVGLPIRPAGRPHTKPAPRRLFSLLLIPCITLAGFCVRVASSQSSSASGAALLTTQRAPAHTLAEPPSTHADDFSQPVDIPPTSALPNNGATPDLLTQFFAGDWAGQLEYRDFQTNARTFLPTWLTMTSSADGRAVTLAFLFDDGPGKTVRESSLLTFFPQAQSVTLASATDGVNERFAVAGFEAFLKLRRGTLVLTGASKENGKPVDVRMTLTLRRNLFVLRKETRAAQTTEEFQFRDAYTLTRAVAPQQAG